MNKRFVVIVTIISAGVTWLRTSSFISQQPPAHDQAILNPFAQVEQAARHVTDGER